MSMPACSLSADIGCVSCGSADGRALTAVKRGRARGGVCQPVSSPVRRYFKEIPRSLFSELRGKGGVAMRRCAHWVSSEGRVSSMDRCPTFCADCDNDANCNSLIGPRSCPGLGVVFPYRVDLRGALLEPFLVDASALDDVGRGFQRHILDGTARHQPGRNALVGGRGRRGGYVTSFRAACANQQG